MKYLLHFLITLLALFVFQACSLITAPPAPEVVTEQTFYPATCVTPDEPNINDVVWADARIPLNYIPRGTEDYLRYDRFLTQLEQRDMSHAEQLTVHRDIVERVCHD